MYLIIDEQYRVYKARFISGYVRSQAKKGGLSIINMSNNTGMDINGDWSDLQKWDSSFKVGDDQDGRGESDD